MSWRCKIKHSFVSWPTSRSVTGFWKRTKRRHRYLEINSEMSPGSNQFQTPPTSQSRIVVLINARYFEPFGQNSSLGTRFLKFFPLGPLITMKTFKVIYNYVEDISNLIKFKIWLSIPDTNFCLLSHYRQKKTH